MVDLHVLRGAPRLGIVPDFIDLNIEKELEKIKNAL